MHLSLKSVCNKEHKGVICNTTSSRYSQSTHPTGRVFGKNCSSLLDFTRNYERASGIYVPCHHIHHYVMFQDHATPMWIAAQMGHLNIVRELIVAGAVVDSVREVGIVSIDYPI